MAINKDLLQNFSNFKGLDVRSSDLTRSQDAAKEIINFEIEKNFSLGGAKGMKLAADFFNFQGGPILGCHTYKYKDQVTGEVKEELLVVSKDLWRLKKGALHFSRTTSGSPTTWGCSFLLDATSQTFKFKVYDDGVEQDSYDIGTGLENSPGATTTISALIALAFSSPYSVSVSPASSVVLASSAHIVPLFDEKESYAPGGSSDTFPIWYWEKVTSFADDGNLSDTEHPFQPYYDFHDQPETLPLVFLNQNNCCYIACSNKLPLLKYDGVNLYQAGVGEVIKEDLKVSGVSNTPAVVGTFRYYVRYMRRDAQGNYIYGRGAYSEPAEVSSGEAPEVSLFALPSTAKGLTSFQTGIYLGEDTTTAVAGNTITFDDPIDESGLPYYGYSSRLVPGDLIYISGTNSVEAWRYITAIDRENQTITFSGDTVDPGGSSPEMQVYKSYFELQEKRVTVGASITDASTFAVTAGHNVIVGDFLYFSTTGEWFEVIDLPSASTMTIDGKISTGSSTEVATNMPVELYRTEDEGTEKFYLAYRGDGASAVVDETADDDLGVEIDIPTNELDFLKDRPSVIASHQGVTVASGGLIADRIFYEDFQYQEAFPLATNFHDLPSQDAGVITALWSDTYDQLAVFKDSAYYSVVGDFTADIPILVSTPNTEGDVGISHQTSILKIRGMNIGVGPLGFVAFKSGQINYELSKFLDSEFLVSTRGVSLSESERLRTERTIAVNDRFNQQAMFFIPAMDAATTDGEIDNFEGANDNSKLFIFDYSEGAWLRRKMPATDVSEELTAPFLPSSGMVIFGDELYFISNSFDALNTPYTVDSYNSYVFKRKESAVSNVAYDYADQHEAIEYDYQSQWYFGPTPLADRLFQYLKIYAFESRDYTDFDVRVRTYIDWDTTTAIDDVTLSFTSGTPTRLLKLSATRGQAIMIRLTVNAVHTKPTITGYELIPAEVDTELEGIR